MNLILLYIHSFVVCSVVVFFFFFFFVVFFFFKQKTAYEIRPRDWSSDVCSSDLNTVVDGVVRSGLKSYRSPIIFDEKRSVIIFSSVINDLSGKFIGVLRAKYDASVLDRKSVV